MALSNIVYSTLTNKCPRCNRGKVFEINNPYAKSAFKMHEDCSECKLHYEMEPGFFYGAMYVSYALMSGIFMIWFLINYLWMGFGPWELIGIIVGSMLIFFPVAFRWARTLWLNFFIQFEKNYSASKN